MKSLGVIAWVANLVLGLPAINRRTFHNSQPNQMLSQATVVSTNNNNNNNGFTFIGGPDGIGTIYQSFPSRSSTSSSTTTTTSGDGKTFTTTTTNNDNLSKGNLGIMPMEFGAGDQGHMMYPGYGEPTMPRRKPRSKKPKPSNSKSPKKFKPRCGPETSDSACLPPKASSVTITEDSSTEESNSSQGNVSSNDETIATPFKGSYNAQSPEHDPEAQLPAPTLEAPEYTPEEQLPASTLEAPEYTPEEQSSPTLSTPEYAPSVQRPVSTFDVPEYSPEAQSIAPTIEAPEYPPESQSLAPEYVPEEKQVPYKAPKYSVSAQPEKMPTKAPYTKVQPTTYPKVYSPISAGRMQSTAGFMPTMVMPGMYGGMHMMPGPAMPMFSPGMAPSHQMRY